MTKVQISNKDLDTIRGHAKAAFDSRPTFEGMTNSDIQIWCIAQAIDRFVVSKGGVPGFNVQQWVQQDCESIDGGEGYICEE